MKSKELRLWNLTDVHGWNRTWKIEEELAKLQPGDPVIVIVQGYSRTQFRDAFVTRTTKTQVLIGEKGGGATRYWKKNGCRVGDRSSSMYTTYKIVPDCATTCAVIDKIITDREAQLEKKRSLNEARSRVREHKAWRQLTAEQWNRVGDLLDEMVRKEA